MTAPFAKIIVPAAAGVVAARLVEVPVGVAAACFATTFVCTMATGRLAIANIYLWFTIALFFFGVGTAMRPRGVMPLGVRLEMVAQIADPPAVRGRWQTTTATVGHFRIPPDTVWRRADERIQLSVDTCYALAVGQQIGFGAWLNPIDTTGGSYGRLMHMRGLHGRAYLTAGNLIRTAPHRSRTPVYYASLLQQRATERISRLNLSPEAAGIVAAMTAGDKRAIDRDTRAGYGATGAAHLLAVSGLHVGIVFVLVNLLLWALPAMRRGHIYKGVAAVAAIWAYAVTAGLAPSVVRAALMFSFAQAALASGSHRNALNIMLGSAVVMLALNPNWWGDPSFMLSYAAVLSIAAFFGPVYERVRTRWKIANALISVIIIGVVASLGTAPLVAYWFGNIPVAGMAINPAVIVTPHVIVMFGVLWMVAPAGFLEPVFSCVLNAAAGVQNAVVEWGAAQPWASIPVGDVPLWSVVAVYLLYAALAMLLDGTRGKRGRAPELDIT